MFWFLWWQKHQAALMKWLMKFSTIRLMALFLLLLHMSSNLASRCTSAGVPVILFNRSQDDDTFSAITSDNILGGKKIARFLVAGGHKRIGYIAGWEGASTQRDRETGFVEELKQQRNVSLCP